MEVDSTSPELIEFIDSELLHSETFRYFQSRSIDAVNNHIVTLLLCHGDEIIGYAHIDFEEKYWLGIYISKLYRGRGLGIKLMNALLQLAKDQGVVVVHLSVDKVNVKAVRLYKNYGFEIIDQKELIYFMKKSI